MGTARFDAPDLAALPFVEAPDVKLATVEVDGVLPEGFYSSTNLPTWVRADGEWKRAKNLRMDCALVRAGDGWVAVEGRRVSRGDVVVLGEREDASQGIWSHPVSSALEPTGEFRFMSQSVSRERPIDYDQLAAQLLERSADGGRILWVVGPAVVHAAAREHLSWFIDRGFVSCLLAGNALATHDIERSMFGTSLGVRPDGTHAPSGHSLHLRAINRVRRAGSIAAAVQTGEIAEGIMHTLVRRNVPFVLAGSIRDDGPLPGVVTDALDAQVAMRRAAERTTCAIFLATALHSIATANMLPAYYENSAGELCPLTTICVDQTEYVVDKLHDRGSHQAFGIVTNVQDFLAQLRIAIERAGDTS